MKVMVKETGKIETLELRDANGINWARDLIGNWGGLSDGQFTANDDGVYECSQDTYDWWVALIAKHQQLDDRIAELREEHGADAVQDALDAAGDYNDLEDLVNAQIAALDEAFPEVPAGN